jgi:predicted cupin superfamily sugar epimerase
MNAQDIIKLLNLEPLPQEGGYFRQTYKSAETLPNYPQQPRPVGTAIYFLLTPDDFSAMHRLDSDEVYHFYGGDPVELLLLYPDGTGEVFMLGNALAAGMRPQKVVSQGVWQGSRLRPGGTHGFALLGTSMTPGFEWTGFVLAEGAELVKQYPAFAAMIRGLS